MATASRPRIPFRLLSAALLLAGLFSQALAQAPAPSGVYTCTDASGRQLRSDRPIPECADREQRVLSPSGTVRARIGPTLTAQERAQQAAQEKEAADARARAAEEKRRDRALLMRYPNAQVHDQERAGALAKIASVVELARQRIDDLMQEKRKNDAELEFYQGDPNKAPPALRRQIDYVAQRVQSQQRFIQSQEQEIQRTEARFDEERERLKQLWRQQDGSAAPRAATRP